MQLRRTEKSGVGHSCLLKRYSGRISGNQYASNPAISDKTKKTENGNQKGNQRHTKQTLDRHRNCDDLRIVRRMNGPAEEWRRIKYESKKLLQCKKTRYTLAENGDNTSRSDCIVHVSLRANSRRLFELMQISERLHDTGIKSLQINVFILYSKIYKNSSFFIQNILFCKL